MASGGSFHAKRKIERQSPWPNLPDDIIVLILNRLDYIDHVSFRAVCKGWREANIGEIVKSADKLPWMMAIGADLACYLYDPFHKRKYTIENGGLLTQARVLASKHGWVLFKRDTNLIFLYNPFRNKMIQLPELRMMRNDKATFINSPVSKDCEIFVVTATYSGVFISKCRPGDEAWTEYSFNIQEYEKSLPENKRCMLYKHGGVYCRDVEYVKGVVYCLVGPMMIAALNVAENRLTMFRPPGPENRCPSGDYLIESDGNLFIAQIDDFPENATIFRFQSSEWKWFEVNDLKDKSLFLNHTSLLFPVEEESGLMNTVHSCQCYPQPFQVGTPSCSHILQIYDWYDGDYDWYVSLLLYKFWIQPA